MTVFYDPLVYLPRVLWSKTIYPRVLKRLEFWLCLSAHTTLVVLLWRGHLQLPEERNFLVPLELVAPLFFVTGLTAAQLANDCRRWHEAITRSSVRIGEDTRRFVQEIQASFGRFDEVLPLRFVAAKYALAAVYVFFFTMSGGAMTACGWSEIRAKGLLVDREVQFMEKQYNGDRIAVLHIWSMWAAQEAAAHSSVRATLGSEAIAGSLGRLSDALRGASDAAREASGCAAVPVPYHQFQLHDSLTLVSMLVLAAIAAPPVAASCAAVFGHDAGNDAAVGTSTLTDCVGFAASVIYVVVLLAALGFREAAAALSDPLRGVHCFPVAATVNTTADAVAQLLIASTPAAFSPVSSWWDAAHCLLTQSQIERRTPQASFGTAGANPVRFRERKPLVPGDQAPPPLVETGCCHLDVDALPSMQAAVKGPRDLVSRRPRQAIAGALLQRVQFAVENCKGESFKHKLPSASTEDPSEDSCSSVQQHTDTSEASVSNNWHEIADTIAALPREHSLASSITGFCYPGAIGASKATAAAAAARTNAAARSRGGSANGGDDGEGSTSGMVVKGTWAVPLKQPAGDTCPRTPPVQTSSWSHRGSSVCPDDLVLTTAPGPASGCTRRL